MPIGCASLDEVYRPAGVGSVLVLQKQEFEKMSGCSACLRSRSWRFPCPGAHLAVLGAQALASCTGHPFLCSFRTSVMVKGLDLCDGQWPGPL